MKISNMQFGWAVVLSPIVLVTAIVRFLVYVPYYLNALITTLNDKLEG